jgi:hypothetical protein
MSQTLNAAVAVVGIDIGKNSFHIAGHDERGAIVLRQKWSRGQVEARFANMLPCPISRELSCLRLIASRSIVWIGSLKRPLLAVSGRSPNLVSGTMLSCDSAARLVAICSLPTDSGWLEHDLLQAIATGDDDHEVEFALLLHQTSGESASLCSFLGDAHGV